MLILLDNGHGSNTPGKQSPCSTFREYQFTRTLAAEIHTRLTHTGIKSILLTPEKTDTPLYIRCRRANQICRQNPSLQPLLISLHVNAAGKGQHWMNARGWSVYVANNASQKSKTAAATIAKTAADNGLRVRRPLPQTPYWTANLAILRDTTCPAILTENLFMDNIEDLHILQSPDTISRLAQIHISAIRQLQNTLPTT